MPSPIEGSVTKGLFICFPRPQNGPVLVGSAEINLLENLNEEPFVIGLWSEPIKKGSEERKQRGEIEISLNYTPPEVKKKRKKGEAGAVVGHQDSGEETPPGPEEEEKVQEHLPTIPEVPTVRLREGGALRIQA